MKPTADQVQDMIAHGARTLYVLAYADWVERTGSAVPAGVEWFSYTPLLVPKVYREDAADLFVDIERLNVSTMADLMEAAAKADGITTWTTKLVEDFGYCLCMQALGNGISWFDNHEEFPLRLPYWQGVEREHSWSFYQQPTRLATVSVRCITIADERFPVLHGRRPTRKHVAEVMSTMIRDCGLNRDRPGPCILSWDGKDTTLHV